LHDLFRITLFFLPFSEDNEKCLLITSNNFYGTFPDSTNNGAYSEIAKAAILIRFSCACGMFMELNNFSAAYLCREEFGSLPKPTII